jgi:hypothetical protein
MPPLDFGNRAAEESLAAHREEPNPRSTRAAEENPSPRLMCVPGFLPVVVSGQNNPLAGYAGCAVCQWQIVLVLQFRTAYPPTTGNGSGSMREHLTQRVCCKSATVRGLMV